MTIIKPIKQWRAPTAPAFNRVPTLRDVLEDYLERRKLAPGTIVEYETVLARYAPDFLARPIDEITKHDIVARHSEISQYAPYQANQTMRIVRALFFFAMPNYDHADGSPVVATNPVRILSASKSWNKERIRSSWISPAEMPSWFQAVSNRPDPWNDYLILLLLTGLRRREGQGLLWCDVDFTHRCFTVRETKNGDDHTLPMSDRIIELFRKRHERARTRNSELALTWVFPSRYGRNHCMDAHAAGLRIPGVRSFSYHDLRRTFLTTAASLDFNSYTIKQLGNHKVSTAGDVTFRYIIKNIERLRKPMQMITDEILRQAGIVQQSERPERKSMEAHAGALSDADWQNYLL